VYVRPDNLDRVVRYYSGAGFTPEKFAWGWMPPHPTFFVRRELYERYGLFHADYRIAVNDNYFFPSTTITLTHGLAFRWVMSEG